MNYLSQHTKKNWLSQAIFSILSFYKLEQDSLVSKTIEVIFKAWISFLFVLATTGILKLIFEFITNPSQFSNTSYGIFDYI